MTLRELALLGRKMREAQRDYSRRQRAADLDEAKAREADFDRALAAVLDPPQPSLFPDPADPGGAYDPHQRP